MYIPRDPPVVLHVVNLLVAGIAASHFPTCISRSGTWLRFEWAITRTEDKCTTIVPATRLEL